MASLTATPAGCSSACTGGSRSDGRVVTTGHVPPPVAPDPAPAIRLREYLASARAVGVSFDDAWQEALDAAVEGTPKREKGHWSMVLAGLRSQWQAAYERTPAASSFRL
jgi:hypothetical protein